MTEDQKAKVEGCVLDFRDGEWLDLRPPLTLQEMISLCDQHILDAAGFDVIRLDEFNYSPPTLGLTVWRRDGKSSSPTIFLDVTILAGDYDYVAVRTVEEEGLAMPTLITHHAINPWLSRYAMKHRLKEVQIREIMGNDSSISVRTSTAPLLVYTSKMIKRAAAQAKVYCLPGLSGTASHL
ncbi:hypothetical protein OCUBac02_49450 (plasmid) [Bosea sp. ANAM02]|nr:hypothetical protein OCUBac02_49450 [Bosea sp. ANAM02]